ncbi:tRNA (guanine-N(1)-)-methyltransferase [bioreactor metagenome]|uniref:tRNA (guanine-N(1)-)-methyltransferase n=1 Tax=bioreactor metagenome TaxID=1076179 RepID=A0A645CVE2_9ZZZZ
MTNEAMSHSIMGRAQKEGLINIKAIDIRDFSEDKNRRVDDYPYGGGCGMIMQPGPVFDAFKYAKEAAGAAKTLYMSPKGMPFNQKTAASLALEENIIILCGHYEGIDQRAIDNIQPEEISIGDFILSGGEIAAIAVMDSISRLIPGVLGKEESFINESFSESLLEYPQYTRPYEFMGEVVPDVLISGHHENIKKWRREQSLKETLKKRPDLLEKSLLEKSDLLYLENINREKP